MCQFPKLRAITAWPNSALPSLNTTTFAFTLGYLLQRHRPCGSITRCLPSQLQRPSISVSVCRLYRFDTLVSSLHLPHFALHARAHRRAQLRRRPTARADSGAGGARPEGNHLKLRVRYHSARCVHSPHTAPARTSVRNCCIARRARAPCIGTAQRLPWHLPNLTLNALKNSTVCLK